MDGGNATFCGEGEVGFHHPVVIGGLFFEYLFDSASFVFSEIEHFVMMRIVSDVSAEVSPIGIAGEFAEGFYVVDNRCRDRAMIVVFHTLIAIQLSFQNFVGCLSVGVGAMGVFWFIMMRQQGGGNVMNFGKANVAGQSLLPTPNVPLVKRSSEVSS